MLWLVVLLGRPISGANMETFKPRHCGPGDYPRFAAIEEDGLYYCLVVKSGCNKGLDILATKNLPDAGPGGTGFLHLGVDRLDVIVVLGQEAPKILENFNPLQHVPTYQKLLVESRYRQHCHLPLLFSFHPDLTILRESVSGVCRKDLHSTQSTSLAPFEPALLRDFH